MKKHIKKPVGISTESRKLFSKRVVLETDGKLNRHFLKLNLSNLKLAFFYSNEKNLLLSWNS